MLALVLIDFRAKSAAQSTSSAWQEAQSRKLMENQDLRRSELAAYIEGHPEKTTAETDKHRSLAVTTVERYRWRGIFRDYGVEVYLGLGVDPAVELIEGPGRTSATGDGADSQ